MYVKAFYRPTCEEYLDAYLQAENSGVESIKTFFIGQKETREALWLDRKKLDGFPAKYASHQSKIRSQAASRDLAVENEERSKNLTR